LKESFAAVLISEEERDGERLSLRQENRHRHREAMLCRVDGTRGGSLLISSEGGRHVHASFASGDQARAAEQRRFGVIVERKEGDRAERLGDGAQARGDGSAEQLREESGLLPREASGEPGLLPWELLRAVKAKREGEAQAPSFAIGEASRP